MQEDCTVERHVRAQGERLRSAIEAAFREGGDKQWMDLISARLSLMLVGISLVQIRVFNALGRNYMSAFAGPSEDWDERHVLALSSLDVVRSASLISDFAFALRTIMDQFDSMRSRKPSHSSRSSSGCRWTGCCSSSTASR